VLGLLSQRPRTRRDRQPAPTPPEIGLVVESQAWRHGQLAHRFDSTGFIGKPILRRWL